ncbi:tetratricopeptide repeat protein [Moorellaceae bacterium AZ2]
MATGKADRLTMVWQRVAYLKKAGDWEGAAAELESALESWPDEPSLLLSLAGLYARLGRYQEADCLADRVLENNPRDSRALLLKGQVAARRDDHLAAVEYLQAAFEQERTPYLAARLAQAYINAGQPEKAANFCRGQLSLDPDQVEIWKKLGLALERLGDASGAAQAYREVLNRSPEDAFVQARYVKLAAGGDEQGGSGLLREIEAFLKVEKRAQNPHLHAVKGRELYRQGRYEEAAAAYRQSLELAPGDPYFLAQLGFCLYRLNRETEALEVLEQALEKRPADVHVCRTLITLYRRLGRQQEGAEFLRSIAGRDPAAQKLWGLARKLERETHAVSSEE